MWNKIGSFGVILILLFSGICIVSASENLDGSDWKYYEKIVILESSGESLRNYQVLLELDSDNFSFSGANNDGSDLRFYDEDGEEIDYWIEYYDHKKKNAKIWVEVPLIHANDETEIELYYGNDEAKSKSDGDKTFEFFDDFLEEDLDFSKWKTNAGSVISLENGVIYMWDDWDFNEYYLSTDDRFRAPLVVEARAKLPCISCASDLEVGFLDSREDYHKKEDAIFVGCDSEDRPGHKFIFYKERNIISLKQKILADDWFNIKVVYLDDKIKFWDSDSNDTQTFIDGMNTPFYLALSGDTDSHSNENSIDWIFVRKYAKKEPTLQFKKEEIKETNETEIQEMTTLVNETSKIEILENTTEDIPSQENMTREEVLELINSISTKIDFLNRKKIDTSLIETALYNAKDAYDSKEHNESIELAINAQKMADKAYEALSEHLEPAKSELYEAKLIGADVSEAEEKFEEAEDALIKGNYEYAKDWADNASDLAKNAPILSIEIKDLKAIPTKYDQRTILISGVIRDINEVYGEGYTFALDDGSGMISVEYNGILGDIEDGDKVTIKGVFQASSGNILADDVQNGGGVPGFEIVFAIVGLLVVAYVLKRP